jgi:hypothetical protein
LTLGRTSTDLLTLDPGQDDFLGDASVDRLGQLNIEGGDHGDQHRVLLAYNLCMCKGMSKHGEKKDKKKEIY